MGVSGVTLKVAAIQYRPPKGDPVRARSELVASSQAAAQAGAKLIVCPEMATTGYIWASSEAIRPFAEIPCGPTFEALRPVAQRHRAWIVCGYVEQEGEALFNAALVIGPSGKLIASYRKCYLFCEDERWAHPGRERLLIDMGEPGSMMPAICMDLNDDGLVAVLRQQQPGFLAFCTNWVDSGEDPLPYWRERLVGWRGCLIAANSWGPDEHTGFTGLSTIVGPDGEVLARAPASGNHVLIATVQPVSVAAEQSPLS